MHFASICVGTHKFQGRICRPCPPYTNASCVTQCRQLDDVSTCLHCLLSHGYSAFAQSVASAPKLRGISRSYLSPPLSREARSSLGCVRRRFSSAEKGLTSWLSPSLGSSLYFCICIKPFFLYALECHLKYIDARYGIYSVAHIMLSSSQNYDMV